MAITEKQIRKAQLQAQLLDGKRVKIYAGDGLVLEVSAGRGIAAWSFKYRHGGKQRRAAIGRWPAISIAQARTAARDLRMAIDGGSPPHAIKLADRTFAALADEWYKVNHSGMAVRHARGVERYLNYAKEAFGDTPIAKLTAPTVLEALRKIEDRGAHETARRVRLYTSLVHSYAVATGKCQSADPAAPLKRKGVLKPKPRVRSHPMMPLNAIPAWLVALKAAPFATEVKMACAFTTLTVMRSGEVLGLTWAEVAADNASLTVPAERMKGRRAHTVLLSPQARKVLDTMEVIGGREGFVFPGKGGSVPLSDMAMSMALRRTYTGVASMHGMRAAFSTWAHGAGHNPMVIERCLAHVQGDKVAAAYNRQTWDAEARKVWSEWANVIGA